MLAIQYSSMLGDCGKYTMSNEIADMSAKLQLQLYRPQKVWWHKYNNLWNDNLKKKDKEVMVRRFYVNLFLCKFIFI